MSSIRSNSLWYSVRVTATFLCILTSLMAIAQEQTGATAGGTRKQGQPDQHNPNLVNPQQQHVDVSNATKVELTASLALSESDADKIIADQPYKNWADFKKRTHLAPKTYKKIKSRVTFGTN